MSVYEYFESKYGLRQLILEYIDTLIVYIKVASQLDDLRDSEDELADAEEEEDEETKKEIIKDIAKNYPPKIELFQKKSKLDNRLREMKSLMEERMNNRQTEFSSQFGRALDNKTPAELTNDVRKFQRDLAEAKEPNNFYVLKLEANILEKQRRFLTDVLFELNTALKNRDVKPDKLAQLEERLQRTESHLQQWVLSLEENVIALREDLARSLATGSSHEKLADRLLDQAKSTAEAEKRIRDQWKEERENAPEENRRDIDRIYHKILEQFREKL